MKKPSNVREQLTTAKILHKAGLVSDAEKIYKEILAVDHDNAEVISLLAEAVQEKGDLKLAKKFWKRALEAKSPPWVFLHNLNGLLQLLIMQEAKDEAVKLLRQPLPDWPAVRVPDSDERETLMSLTKILVNLGQTEKAGRLLKSIVSSLPTDAGLLHALGEIQILTGDMSAARKTLTAADNAMQPSPSLRLLADLYRCALAEHDKQVALDFKRRGAALCPVYSSSQKPGQKVEILVFNQMQFDEIKSDRLLHFNGNYPSQIAHALADEFHFSSVFAEFMENRAAVENLPAPDLIINNLANGEQLLADGTLSAVTAFADSFTVPVVNHPGKVVHTTRDRSAELIADLPGVVVPRTSRFLKDEKSVEDLINEIEAQFDYPLITRTIFSQEGKGMTRVESRDSLARILQTGVPEAFFVTEFVDSRGATGYYRKIRAAIVADEIIIFRADYDTDWNVHGRTSDARVAFYLGNPQLLAEEDRICTDPDAELGQPVMQSLRRIRERIPLEIFGVDFDVAPDGRLVFYEANATMNLLSAAPAQVAPPKHAEARLLSAFRRFLRGLAGSTNAQSTPQSAHGSLD
jgi:Flp pilus assembly protein TadD